MKYDTARAISSVHNNGQFKKHTARLTLLVSHRTELRCSFSAHFQEEKKWYVVLRLMALIKEKFVIRVLRDVDVNGVTRWDQMYAEYYSRRNWHLMSYLGRWERCLTTQWLVLLPHTDQPLALWRRPECQQMSTLLRMVLKRHLIKQQNKTCCWFRYTIPNSPHYLNQNLNIMARKLYANNVHS